MSFRKQELKAALASRDPYRVANVLGDLPPISPQTQVTPKTHKESLHVDGTDWSNVLSSWLDACDAASKVSHECEMIGVYYGEPPRSCSSFSFFSSGQRHQMLRSPSLTPLGVKSHF
jgi:hypothetical protein